MSYLLESKKAVLKDINAANGRTLTLDQISFGVPAPSQGSWLGNATLYNTVCRLNSPSGSEYEGHVDVAYDRLDLARLTLTKGWRAIQTNPTTIHNLLPYIRYFTGTDLTGDDIEDGGFSSNGDGTYAGTLIAKAGSIGWIGSVPVTVYPGGSRLEDIIVDDTMNGLNYPTAADDQPFGLFYMYPYNFTPYFDTLVDIEDGALTGDQITALVAAFKATDISSGKDLWNENGASTTWSLAGAECVSNGLNGSDLPTNPAYKYVMVLRLRSGVVAPAGDMYLHYNDPVV